MCPIGRGFPYSSAKSQSQGRQVGSEENFPLCNGKCSKGPRKENRELKTRSHEWLTRRKDRTFTNLIVRCSSPLGNEEVL
ncbi:hypothetical protein AgCh_024849 [Apium graveolens]